MMKFQCPYGKEYFFKVTELISNLIKRLLMLQYLNKVMDCQSAGV